MGFVPRGDNGIMKRVRLMVLTILVLFVMPLAFAQNVNAADGDESTDSIYGFSETLPDDVMFMLDNESYGSGYAESFADVSDYTTSDTSISTDGDVATITENGAGSTGRAYASFASTDFFEYYYEFQISTMTATTVNLEFWDGAAYNTLEMFTVAGTYKGMISDTDAATMQRIGFLVGSNGGNIKPDYLRISPANESGWQHDCSTVAYTTALRVDVESDGDHIQFQYSGGGGTGELSFHTDFGGSAIAIIDTNYYPFIGWNVVNLTDDYYEVYVDDTLVYTGTGLGLQHANVKASGEAEYTTITFVLNTVTESMALDWVKGYSIANFTVTESGVGLDDYLYVDSGILYSNVDDGYIEVNHDPVLVVNGATYPIYNLTTSGTVPEFSYYVSGWSSYSAETRGAIVGVCTDIKLNFSSTEIISEIVFIEDGTAPIISDFWIVPYTPTEEDNVTFAIYETDAGAGTYTVIFNAVEYPAGFVDVDLDAVESSEIDGLWSYTIDSSDLPAGYYVFEVIASDGANEGTELTIFEVIDVTENIFELLFLSTEMWGYLGPVGLVVIGFLLTKKERSLGIFMIIVDSLIIAQYLALIEATPEYWWHVIILLLGVVQCAIVLIDR